MSDRIRSRFAGYRDSPLVIHFARVLFALRRSFFLSLLVLGIVVFALGATVMENVLAGMMGIWGATLILIGGGAYGIMWVIRYVLRDRTAPTNTSEAKKERNV